MSVFILLLFLGVAVLWLLLSFCFIPIGKFVYRLIKDAKTSMSKDDYKEKTEEEKDYVYRANPSRLCRCRV